MLVLSLGGTTLARGYEGIGCNVSKSTPESTSHIFNYYIQILHIIQMTNPFIIKPTHSVNPLFQIEKPYSFHPLLWEVLFLSIWHRILEYEVCYFLQNNISGTGNFESKCWWKIRFITRFENFLHISFYQILHHGQHKA